MAMETMTRVNEQMDVAAKKPMAVQPGVARMRELTPAQRRAVMFAQQQVLKAQAAKKAKDQRQAVRERMWDTIRRRTSRLPPPSPWWLRRSLAKFRCVVLSVMCCASCARAIAARCVKSPRRQAFR